MHDVQANESTCSAKTCSTMHCHSLAPASVIFCYGNEVSDNLVFWAGAVGELHLVNLDGVSGEALSLVQFPVQTENTFDVQVEEWVD